MAAAAGSEAAACPRVPLRIRSMRDRRRDFAELRTSQSTGEIKSSAVRLMANPFGALGSRLPSFAPCLNRSVDGIFRPEAAGRRRVFQGVIGNQAVQNSATPDDPHIALGGGV